MSMNIEQELLNALVQVFTRGRKPSVSLQVADSLPIPPFSITILESDFLDYLKRVDLSILPVAALVDLGTLYFREIEEVLTKELHRRKSAEPDFGDRLAREVMPRLRDPDKPSWRYSD
jgi:hypothetical protein